MGKPPTERFIIDGIVLDIPGAVLTATLRDRLAQGLYEAPERRLLHQFVQPGDRVLDLGAGAGLVAMLAAGIVGAEKVTAVEANPAMHPVIRRNFRLNGLSGIRLIRGAVGASGDTVTFHVHPGFWSASLIRNPKLTSQPVEVPVKRFANLVRRRAATAVLMDIEGAEQHILADPIPASVRLMVIELHPLVYGADTAAALVSALKQQGFAMSAQDKGGSVIAMTRG
ncbi:MAG: FkbM family methyltransferase [Paracoccus sp. (in: a-proteobacteria)]|nr:FkbM family methyltransferase [Paracoccus sp. (in: a-proteobacteria)]